MNRLVTLILVCAALLVFGCSNAEDEDFVVVARYNEDGVKYSPMVLSGSIDYLESMRIKSIKIVRLDGHFNVVDTLSAKKGLNNNKPIFSLNELDYPSQYVKVLIEFSMDDDSGVMAFEQFADITQQKYGFISVNLVDALVSGRIERLMKKDECKDWNECGFLEARNQAYEEILKMFAVQKIGFNESFIYCKHQVSDSVFYATYKDLRKILEKGDTLSTAKKVSMADAYLDAFEVQPENDFFKNVSRDSSYDNYSFFCNFISWGYGLKELNQYGDWGDTVVISQKSSKYKGRYLVFDGYGFLNTGYWRKWRLNTELEDTLGYCLFTMDTTVSHNGEFYHCGEHSSAWVVLENYQDILSFLYGKCSSSDIEKKWRLRNDSLFTCAWNTNGYAWKFKKEDEGVDTSDADYPKYLDAWATSLFGVCQEDSLQLYKKHQIDSVFVQCFSGSYTWRQIDPMRYYLGDCSSFQRDSIGTLPNGISYICSPDVDGVNWLRILGDEYDGEPCSNELVGDGIEFEGKSFVCEQRVDSEYLGDQHWLQKGFLYLWIEW